MAQVPDTAAADPAAATPPKYYAVKQHLLDLIVTLRPGAPVPTERELASDLDTSRTTVRQALSELVVEGKLVRRQGSGTYVADPKITWPLYLASYTEQEQANGFTPSSQILRTGRIPAGTDLAGKLGVAVRAPVYKIERVRAADFFPIAVETSWLPAERFPGITRLIRTHGSLYAVLAEHYATKLHTGEEWIETAPATPREAGPLGIDVGTPMLIVNRLNFDPGGAPVELGRTWFRSDRVTLVTQLGPGAR